MADRPTYDELLAMYFRSEQSRIAERSSNISGDTLKLWRQCCDWAESSLTAQIDGDVINDYLEMEAQEEKAKDEAVDAEVSRTPRHLSDVLNTMLIVVPNSEREFRSQLEALLSSSLYQPPEIQGALWSKAGDVLEQYLGAPPLTGWKEVARKLFMGEPF